ncbi:TetR/AcrR family transcriptional regulator C-terminal domain-containing protein [Kribbella antibiotica]|uniref:TetR/AcrR family transcriptional regulator C-terminal domain-containing protein n=1 Tax=Kribbella antibiotica TaxID=190195 RepID=UPI001EDD3074|nr:TetR/AcrR family transcriptional regulator C-terminal domain-containing protein [Kribbella antibiotica]
MTESIWTRKLKTSPARETLTREQIVRTALETLDAEGLAGLSMRKLAAKLGSGATSLYWHVPTKDDLIDLLIDEVWGEIDIPEPELAGWRSGTLLYAHSMRSTIMRHPWLPEVMYTRPSMGPNAMTMGTRGLALIAAAGITGRNADFALGTVMSFVLGSAGGEVATREMARRAGQSIDQLATAVLESTQHLGDTTMQESARRRATGDIDGMFYDSFTYGLEIVLEGIAARIKN